MDAEHSKLDFSVRHVMVATVRGRFKDFGGALAVDPSGYVAADARIAADSVETDNPTRDASLRSPDFFWAERYPTIEFTATAVRRLEGRQLRIDGQLTLRGVTRPIELHAIVRDVSLDDSGNPRIELALRAEVRHRDFGLGRRILEAHGVVLGDKVEVRAEVSAVKAEAAAALAA